jgi:hypothetical protein
MPTTLQPHSPGIKRLSFLFLIAVFAVNDSFSQTTIFTTQIPLATTNNDHKSTVGQEIGVKFHSTAAGFITGIRFYKTMGNTGTHTGELYSSSGVRLAQATFVNEMATGWQTVIFPSPVAITSNTTYTAAYFSSLGNYTEDNDYFKGHSVTNSPLTAFADGTNGASGTDPGNGQGTYKYTAAPSFPNQLYRSANYWVDVIYSPSPTSTTNIFTSQTPVAATNNDFKSTGGHEVGVKFSSTKAGYISGLRFYKSAGNVGTHIGELYSSSGVHLASATFINETDTGWQSVLLPTAIAIAANTTYTAAYFSSLGNYTEDNHYFLNHSVTNSPLTAPADGTNGGNGTDPGNGQGTYKYTASPAFPNQLYKSANYWVDVIFSTTQPPLPVAIINTTININFPTDHIFLNGDASTGNIANYKWTMISGPNTPAIDSSNSADAMVNGIVEGVYVFQLSLNGGASKAQVTITVKFPPPQASPGSDKLVVLPISSVIVGEFSDAIFGGISKSFLWTQISGPAMAKIFNPTSFQTEILGLQAGVYIFQQKAFGPGGSGVDSGRIKVTVLPPGLSANIFTTQTPAEGTSNINTGIEVGVKFRSSLPGYISGIRFYKTDGNTGTHTGELYTSGGTRLAQAVFTNETATGWQTVTFSSPVAITDNTTYVAAYFSPNGTITSTPHYFTKEIVNNPLTALKDGEDGSNGVFVISTTPSFPVGVHPNEENYWVDVVYSNGTSSVKANAGQNQNVYAGQTVTLDGSGSTGVITSYTWTEIGGPLNSPDIVITSPNAKVTTISGLRSVIFPSEGAIEQKDYIFQLSVNGGASVSRITIHVDEPPVANAGPNQIVTFPISTANLNSSSSGRITSYTWTKVSGPNTPTFTSPNAANTSVTGLVLGTYVFQLSLNGGVAISQTTVIVNTNPPVANAGLNQTVTLPIFSVLLDGSGSLGSISSYLWTKISGPNGPVIETPNAPTTRINKLVQGSFVYQLSINGGVSTSRVTIVVNFIPPIANAGADNTVVLPVSPFLDGSKSTGSVSTILWTIVSGPNAPVISNPTDQFTSVEGAIPGTYTFQLSVNGGVSTDRVTVTVVNVQANAGDDQTVTLPNFFIQLDGFRSLGTINSYQWSIVSYTGNLSSEVISQPNSSATSVSGLHEGVYVFELALNGGASVSQVTITVNPPPAGSTIFTTQTPASGIGNDHKATTGQEVGVKFKSTTAGVITGLRFYKTPGNSGEHIGELYSSSGALLAQATFTGESDRGWQYVTFFTPVAIAANTTYTAAYFSSLGNYTEDNDYFLHHSVTSGTLTAPEDGTNGASGTDPGNGQGVYKYTSSPAFPNQLFRSANYWVDVLFSTTNTVAAEPAKLVNAKAVDQGIDSTGKLSWFLGQNYPNPVPMSQNTKIEYSIPISSRLELVLFDMQGRPVKIMVNEIKNAGKYTYDLNTGTLAKGLYIYSMHAGNLYAVKKLVVQ